MSPPTEAAVTDTATAPPTATTSSDNHNSTDTMTAITTPFSMPSGCLDFNWAGIDVLTDESGSQRITQLTRNLKDMDEPSCFPNGEYRASYSPAVCPSGWTYYSMIPGESTEELLSTTSFSGASSSSIITDYTNQISALCCPSGFSMSVVTWSMDTHISHPCFRTVTSGELSITVTNQTNGIPTPFKGSATLVVPTPITVFWHATDASTLTPRPPDIPEGSFLPSWVPGQTAVLRNVIQYDDSPSSNRLATGAFAAVIVVPIVIFLAILGCCICCFRIRRRREKREIAKEQEESQALAVERTSTQERTSNPSTDGVADTAAAAPEQGQGSETIAVAAGSSSAAVRQASPEIQPAATQPPPAGNTPVHALSGFTKPPYPGLPSEGFDGIEEPPPYAEAAPSYPGRSAPVVTSPTSPIREHTERTTPDENTNTPVS